MVRNDSYRKNIKKPSPTQFKLQQELQQKKKEIEEINARYSRCLGERLKDHKSLESTYKKYSAQTKVLSEELDKIAEQQGLIEKLYSLIGVLEEVNVVREQHNIVLKGNIEKLEELNKITTETNELLQENAESQPSDEDFRKIFNQQKTELQKSKLLNEEYREKEKKQELSMRQKREKEKVKNTKKQQREIELKEKLTATNNRLKEKEEIQEKLKETIKNANENNCICSICYDGKIDTAFTSWYDNYLIFQLYFVLIF